MASPRRISRRIKQNRKRAGAIVPACRRSVFGPLQILDGPPRRVPWAYHARAGAGPPCPPGPCPPSLGLLCPPGPALDLPGAAGAVPPAWASCAHRGQLPPRLPWAGPPGRLGRGRGRRSRRGSAQRLPVIFPAILPPGTGPGFSPVTRAADFPAHNARPRCSPRNARPNNPQ